MILESSADATRRVLVTAATQSDIGAQQRPEEFCWRAVVAYEAGRLLSSFSMARRCLSNGPIRHRCRHMSRHFGGSFQANIQCFGSEPVPSQGRP